MNRQSILEHPSLSAPGTVQESPEMFQATVPGISELNDLNPTHAAYVYAHNMVSELAEHCTKWKEMSPVATCRAMVPAGDCGKKGELSYIRVLPPPFAGDSTQSFSRHRTSS